MIDVMTQEKRLEFVNALQFLNFHPAVTSGAVGGFLQSQMFWFLPLCENEKDGTVVSIFANSPEAKRFKKEFQKDAEQTKKDEKGLPRKLRMPKSLQVIYMPYKKVYGKEWKFDHVKYYCEISFCVFLGELTNKLDTHYEHKWGRYGGISVKADTFEDLIIECAKEVKEKYGDFSWDSFYTEKEKRNHKKHRPFVFKKSKYPGCRESIFNPKYINVSDGLKNLRWLKWFIQTPYAKKHWKQKDFKLYLDKLKGFDDKTNRDH